MAEVLAKKEELADRLEKANEEAIASAIAEEEQLTREIQAENNDLETDNDFSVRWNMFSSAASCIFAAGSEIKKKMSLLQAGMGNGGCGVNMDWGDVLADYDGKGVNI